MIFVGADGCKAGWFTVLLVEDTEWKVDVFPDVSSLWNKYSSASVILLDVPIGLRERASRERLCDIKARKLLGPKRASSVFPAPCRAAIDARTYEEAGYVNEQMTGRRLSLQTWNIIPKIREVDRLLLNNELARLRIRETHPEICFWALTGGQSMKQPKKLKNGFLERAPLLQAIYPQTTEIIDYTLSTYRCNQVAKDDILDAVAAAITARAGPEALASIPAVPEIDRKGLRMEIVYHDFRSLKNLDSRARD